MVEKAFPEKKEHDMNNYIDDLYVAGHDWKKHMINVEYILRNMKAAGLTTKLKKAKLALRKLEILGFELGPEGIKPSSAKISAVLNFPQPGTVRKVKSFLGLCSFFRKFIKSFSAVARPLTILTKDNVRWHWNKEQQKAFESLKEALTNAPILAMPSREGLYILAVDASDIALGAVLWQEQEGIRKVIAYASRVLSDTETRYSTSCREALAACWGVQKFRQYLDFRHFVLETDHQALKALDTSTNQDSKLIRYSLILQSYDFEVRFVPGKQNVPADFLSRHVADIQMTDERNGKRVLSKTGEKGTHSKEEHVPAKSNYLVDKPHPTTQRASQGAPGHPAAVKECAARGEHAGGIPPREPPITNGSAVCWTTTETVAPEDDGDNNSQEEMFDGNLKSLDSEKLAALQRADADIGPIFKLLENNEIIPENSKKKRKQMTKLFQIKNGIVVKRLGNNIRTAVPKILRRQVLEFYHTQKISGHFGITRTIYKIKQKYVWPNMYSDIKNFIKNCLICQAYKHKQTKPAGLMSVRKINPVWHVCHVDLMGAFPTSRRGNTYLVVFQDETTKAVEIAPLKRANAISVARKFVECVYSRHGAPAYLCSDNGKVFCSKVLASVTKTLGVKQTHIIPYMPQANPAERAIKDISRIIASYAGERQDNWDQGLAMFQMSINTALQLSTKYTPYFLLYGRDIRIPGISDAHLQSTNLSTTDEYAKEVAETLRKAHAHVKKNIREARERQKKYFDAGRSSIEFEINDVVWVDNHFLSDRGKDFCAKLAPKRRGPYRVKDKRSPVAYTLQDLRGGKDIQAHASQMRVYFCEEEPLPDEERDTATPTDLQRTPVQGVAAEIQRPTDDSEDGEEEELKCNFPECREDETDWIFCDICDLPFHCKCINVTIKEAEDLQFTCCYCQEKDRQGQ